MSKNLATKYRPQSFEDVTEQGIIVEIVRKMCKSTTLSNRNFLFTGPAGCGKAQPLYSRVLTPTGYIAMGDVTVGTEVITGNGNFAKVSGVFPQGKRPIYEITLQDHTKIRVSDEHLNVVHRYNQDTKQREDYCLTTMQLIELFNSSRFKLRMDIPCIRRFSIESTPLPIHPYLLGTLIGDGSLHNNFRFANSESDIIAKVDSMLRDGWGKCLVKVDGDNVDYYIRDISYSRNRYFYQYDGRTFIGGNSLNQYMVSKGYPYMDESSLYNIAMDDAPRLLAKYPELRGAISCTINPNYAKNDLYHMLDTMGLLVKSVHKHIPSEYLFSDYDSRIALLQGLFDTDGSIEKTGATVYCTCSPQLSEDFAFLVRSLGIRDTVTTRTSKYSIDGDVKITGTTTYLHHLKIPNGLSFYTSAKHTSRYSDRQNPPLRNIISIEYIGDEECQCIMVDHDDHTYISDDFIVTHNTTIGRLIAKNLNGSSQNVIEIDAASHSGVDDVREIIQEASQYPVGTDYKIILMDEVHALSNTAWQALLKCLEEQVAKTVFIFCTTNPEKIPATILSRVQTFKLSKISAQGIYDRLVHIIECENSEGNTITYDADAIAFLSRYANGGMRDAITSLDKVLAYGNKIDSKLLADALDLPNYDDYFGLLNALVRKDNPSIISILDRVYNSGTNYIKWFESFHSFLCNIVKFIFMQDINKTIIPPNYLEKIQAYTSQHAVLCLKLSNVVLNLNKDLRNTNYQLETSMSYLCVPTAPKKE